MNWFRREGRDLPWRHPDTTPWQVLVSEVMLGQTPVARVAPAYEAWIARWPDAASLAAASPADVIRAWGRLGYPRRALRLRDCAQMVMREYDAILPRTEPQLRALPGIGEYTAAAVLAFAYGQRVAVLDTNVRRVFARAVGGTASAPVSLTNAERAQARAQLPARATTAAEWSVAVMELGALVCTARAPKCDRCPIARDCAWLAAGQPLSEQRSRTQTWEGTDRQCRGRLMALLRESPQGVTHAQLATAWPEAAQRERGLDGLIADGLVDPVNNDRFVLPE